MDGCWPCRTLMDTWTKLQAIRKAAASMTDVEADILLHFTGAVDDDLALAARFRKANAETRPRGGE